MFRRWIRILDRLVLLKPFFKKMFEGMTFFRWGILIIGFMIAGAILVSVKPEEEPPPERSYYYD